MQNNIGISEVDESQLESNRPFFSTRNVQVEAGKQEMALFNSVEPGAAGEHKMESTRSYNHSGQFNPNAFGAAAQQAPENPDPFGNGFNPGMVDQSSAKSLMQNINQIDSAAVNGINNLNDSDFEGVSTVLEHLDKMISMMGEDLDLWVPDDAPKLREQLHTIGSKLIPFLNKYADCIRKLGE